MVTEKLIVVRLKRCFGELQSLLLQLRTPPPSSLSTCRRGEQRGALHYCLSEHPAPLSSFTSPFCPSERSEESFRPEVVRAAALPRPRRPAIWALQSIRRLWTAKKQSRDCSSRRPRMRRLAPLRVGFCWGSGPCWGFRSFVGPRAFTPPLAAALLRGRKIESWLRAAQPVIENPTCCRAQRTGKPLERR